LFLNDYRSVLENVNFSDFFSLLSPLDNTKYTESVLWENNFEAGRSATSFGTMDKSKIVNNSQIQWILNNYSGMTSSESLVEIFLGGIIIFWIRHYPRIGVFKNHVETTPYFFLRNNFVSERLSFSFGKC